MVLRILLISTYIGSVDCTSKSTEAIDGFLYKVCPCYNIGWWIACISDSSLNSVSYSMRSYGAKSLIGFILLICMCVFLLVDLLCIGREEWLCNFFFFLKIRESFSSTSFIIGGYGLKMSLLIFWGSCYCVILRSRLDTI